MRGTGAIGLNGATLYAYFMRDGSFTRVRISVDEADGLNIFDGLRVRVKLPGQEVVDLLITSTNRVPPYVWVHLEPISRQRN